MGQKEAMTTTICQDDQAALDALAEHGYDANAVPEVSRQRAERITELLGVLDTMPEDDASDLLVARTLQAVEAARANEMMAQPDELMVASRGLPFSLREVAAVAAMLLLAFSVMWPILAHTRDAARQIACQANLAMASHGIAAYAAENNDNLPAVQAQLGDPWWNVNTFDDNGNAQSNSAHLFQLVRNGYATLDQLRCSENETAPIQLTRNMRDWPDAEHTSYSYQNQYTTDRARLNRSPSIAVLADKNPFFRPSDDEKYAMGMSPTHSSNNHASMNGQNVLMTDGHVQWMDTPLLRDADNIFHAGATGLDYYTGLEGPADRTDSFLVP